MMNSQDIPADELEELQGLLRLKNYERPAEGYFEDFLDEFQRRQRISAVEGAKEESFLSKASSWFREMGAAKWAIGAGMAYAVLALAFFGGNFFGGAGTQNASGIAKDTEDFLPSGGSLQHVELERETSNKEEQAEKERSEQALPREF